MVPAPSPTAEATRLTDPWRTSPAANTPGRLVSSGSGRGRRVAVLFTHQDFPGVRFGHRFPLDPHAEGREQIWLKEEIETGPLHRMMDSQPTPDDAGITWTTWGRPGLD